MAASGAGGGEGGGALVKGQGLLSAQDEVKRGLKILDEGTRASDESDESKVLLACPIEEPCWWQKEPYERALSRSPMKDVKEPY